MEMQHEGTAKRKRDDEGVKKATNDDPWPDFAAEEEAHDLALVRQFLRSAHQTVCVYRSHAAHVKDNCSYTDRFDVVPPEGQAPRRWKRAGRDELAEPVYFDEDTLERFLLGKVRNEFAIVTYFGQGATWDRSAMWLPARIVRITGRGDKTADRKLTMSEIAEDVSVLRYIARRLDGVLDFMAQVDELPPKWVKRRALEVRTHLNLLKRCRATFLDHPRSPDVKRRRLRQRQQEKKDVNCRACSDARWWCRCCGGCAKVKAMRDAGMSQTDVDAIYDKQRGGLSDPCVPCYLCNRDGKVMSGKDWRRGGIPDFWASAASPNQN